MTAAGGESFLTETGLKGKHRLASWSPMDSARIRAARSHMKTSELSSDGIRLEIYRALVEQDPGRIDCLPSYAESFRIGGPESRFCKECGNPLVTTDSPIPSLA